MTKYLRKPKEGKIYIGSWFQSMPLLLVLWQGRKLWKQNMAEESCQEAERQRKGPGMRSFEGILPVASLLQSDPTFHSSQHLSFNHKPINGSMH
jgi:hypothetical protein